MSEIQRNEEAGIGAYLAVAASFVAALVVVLVLTPQYFSAIVLALPVVVAGLTLRPRGVMLVVGMTILLSAYGAYVAPLPDEVELVRVLSFLAVSYVCVRTAQERQLAHQRAEEAEVARQQIEFERSRWQATVENMLDLVTVCDERGRVTYINPAYERHIGYLARPDLPLAEHPKYYQLYRSDGSLFLPEELPLQKAALTGQEVRGVEIVERTADGRELVAVFNAAPLRDPSGRVVGAVAVGRDITERKRAEAERERLLEQLKDSNAKLTETTLGAVRLREQAERRAEELDTILSAIGDGLIIYGPKLEVERMNAAAESMLGFTVEQWRAFSPAQRVRSLRVETPAGEPISPEEMPGARALRGETVTNYQKMVHRPDGRTLHLLNSTAPIHDAQGGIVGAVSNFTDITELVELQRTQQEIASIVAHDVRQPLTIIQGQAQLMARWLAAGSLEQAKKSNQAILTSAKRMNVMIQDLVDSVRGQLGRLELNRKPVDLGQFLADLLQRSEASYEMGRVHLAIEQGLPPVSADPDRLERIVLNLLSNALKYSTPGTPVEVRARHTDGEALLEIEDRGPGIAPAELPRLFQRFYRAAGASRREGLGLGLYITRTLVEAHGGRIWVESEPGKGSVFRFALPLEGVCPGPNEREANLQAQDREP